MNKIVEYVECKYTGGHYALRNHDTKKPFTNIMKECDSINILPSDIVVDIGAYVGEFSMMASDKGAKQIYSYEPTPDTFEVLTANRRKNMIIRNMAVVGDDRKEIELYISSGIGVTNSIVKIDRKVTHITVPAIRYEEAVKNATIVKIDVEGAEYTYNIIQPNIRALILEFHPIAKQPWQSWAKKIMGDLEMAGFKSIMRPAFSHGWDMGSSWVRE